MYDNAEVYCQSEGEFDHASLLITTQQIVRQGRKAFRYFTMWRSSIQHQEIIRKSWNQEIEWTKMLTVLRKLKSVKLALKELNKPGYNDLQAAELYAYRKMIEIQEKMHQNHVVDGLTQVAEDELQVIQEYKEKHKACLGVVGTKS